MKEKSIPQFLVAAPTSGSGKTTICRGLMALLTKKGYNVQPFKCGPDYIDTKYHAVVCGRPSINLDLFLSSEKHVINLYDLHTANADACVVEGMMGLFDGYERDRGSSAAIAQLLGIPVILVVDARSMAYSAAPLLSGFVNFKPNVKVAGVIFNRVGSMRHYEMLQEACNDIGIACLGYLPKDKMLEQNSRYLGLDFSQSSGMDAIDYLVHLLEQHVDLKQLLDIVELPVLKLKQSQTRSDNGTMNIWVAYNKESFSFIYAAHIEKLEQMGTVTFFDPERDSDIPQDIDLLYLPGGYPERHLKELTAAQQTLSSIQAYAASGGRILAECGGLIYLSKGVVDNEDIHHLVGIFPFYITNRNEDRKLTLGYRQLVYNGQSLHGHEFHYTQLFNPSDIKNDESLDSVAQILDAKQRPVSTPLFRYKNVIASYTHLYWGEIDIMRLF